MNSPIVSVSALVPFVLLSATGASLAQVPANNNFAAAAPVAAGVTVAGTIVNATVEAGEPPTHWTATYAAGVATGKSVFVFRPYRETTARNA